MLKKIIWAGSGDNMEILKIKKLRDDAKVPHRATSGSAGLDLCASIDEPITLEAGDTAVIPTGIAIALPSAEYGAFVFPRSGIAVKHGIGLLNSVGVIDSDYRGEIMVGVINQIKTARNFGMAGVALFDLNATLTDEILPMLSLGIFKRK